MLKSQDCVILVKLLANPNTEWSQRQLAATLFISQSEVHSGIKRLLNAELIRKSYDKKCPHPILSAAEEYLVHGIRYSFPVNFGEYTRGIATGIAAPVFDGKIVLGTDPIPVWPYGKGNAQGVALEPLYHAIPQSIMKRPDQAFYDLLALIDIIRRGKARERRIAIRMLGEKLQYEK